MYLASLYCNLGMVAFHSLAVSIKMYTILFSIPCMFTHVYIYSAWNKCLLIIIRIMVLKGEREKRECVFVMER